MSSRTRPFTGNWEYLLEQAIFTSPPTMNWSGAALVSRDFKLVGVGSLIVREASASGDSALPGNMFVPIDALKPILPDLIRTGRRSGPARPWLVSPPTKCRGASWSRACRRKAPATRPG
jgi:hypothetical protein